MPSQMGIYAIVNLLDGRCYVGASADLDVRFAHHKRDLKLNCHRNPRLQSACNEHGLDAFEFRVLEAVADEALLPTREQYWIESLCSREEGTGYNLMSEGDRRSHADETRLRMSQSHKGQTLSPEHRARIGAAQKVKKRGPLSDEHRAKLSSALQGRTPSQETRQRLSEAKKGRPGKPNTPETREKISAANKGKPKSPEHRARISASRTGQSLSPERYAKLVEVQRNRSGETRARLCESNGKLTPEQVIEIRQKAAHGSGVSALAREYGINHSSMSDIVSGKSWKHLL